MTELFDPVIFRHLPGVGVAEDWTCREIAAGGPCVAAWLADRVGSSGRVVSRDIDASWRPQTRGAFQVVTHYVGEDEPLPGPFDLIREPA